MAERNTMVSVKRVLIPIALLVGLYLTNPDVLELRNQLRAPAKSNSWWMNRILASLASVKGFGFETIYNCGILTVVKAGANSYHVGIAGLWVEYNYWTSIPGWFLMMQFVWHFVTSMKAFYYFWLEFLLSALWFIWLSRRVDAVFEVEKYTSTFFLVSALLTVAIANIVFYPIKLFKNNTHPGSLLYGTASAILVFLTMNQDRSKFSSTLRWWGCEVDLSQLCLLVVVAQLLLGHSLGFSGSVTGVIIYYLAVIGVMDERNWF